jgi:hypothetical protein
MVSVGIHSVNYYIIFSFTFMDTVTGGSGEQGRTKKGSIT